MPFGMMKNDAALCGGFSGLVTAIMRMKSAFDAFDANHLWPLITYSSPSRSGTRRDHRGVAAGEVRLGQRERRRDLAAQQRLEPLLLLLVGVPPMAMSSLLPESGAWLPNTFGADPTAPEDLVHQRQLHLAVALATELGVEMAGPQAAVLHLLLERRDRALPRLVGHVVVEERERLDLLVDEGAHPLELRRELRVGREIPSHDAEYKVGPWDSSRAGSR